MSPNTGSSGWAARTGPTRRGLRCVALSVLPIGVLAWGAVALAATSSAVKTGAIYQGQFGGGGTEQGAVESFNVTGSGRQLASVTVLPIECGVPGGQVVTVHNVPIVKGTFKVKYPGLHFRAGFFGSATLSGRFLAHGRASGREEVRTNDTITGAPCKYSVPWTAQAQPRGTRQCPPHGLGLNIVVDGSTCAVVDKALDHGNFVRPTPSQPGGSFTTSKWKCRVVKGGIQNHRCTRTRPNKASFSFSI
jgi:hypothetical protein